jgi:hypothetical protein
VTAKAGNGGSPARLPRKEYGQILRWVDGLRGPERFTGPPDRLTAHFAETAMRLNFRSFAVEWLENWTGSS